MTPLNRRRLLISAAGAVSSHTLTQVATLAEQPEATPITGTPVVPEMDGQATTIRVLRPGTLVRNFNAAAFAQDPQIAHSYLEPLVRPDPVTMAPTPWLATGWEWRDNGRELRFHLRDGVRWHNGAVFSARDAAFSFEVYRQDAESAVRGLFDLLAEVEAVSDAELVVRFSDRDPNWLLNAATLPVFSEQQYGEWWTQQPSVNRSLSTFSWEESLPLGTGPWRVEQVSSWSVRFVRHGDHWARQPGFDHLEVVFEAGERSRADAWNHPHWQIAWPAPRVSPNPSETLITAPAASVMFAAFNFANPDLVIGSFWHDLRVRQAASMAIDRPRYAEEVFGGAIRWQAAGTVAQPWAHDDTLSLAEPNPEAAAVLLGEAGWIDYDGDGVREDLNGIPLRPVIIVRDDSRRELVEVLARVARDLATVGFGVSIEVLPPLEFADRWVQQRTYDLIAYAYDLLPGFTDFDLYGSAWDIRVNPAGWNPGGYSNLEADSAIADFLSSISMARRRAALSRLQRAVNDDLFGLWLGFPDDRIAIAAGVGGFEPDINWQTAQTWLLKPHNAN